MLQTAIHDVEIRGVKKAYGSNLILRGIDLDVRQGELLTLLGPSGCGKTTTLNVVAGFVDVDAGDVYIKGKRMNGVPPYKRDLGMVFQSYSLFPHMTVYENLEFGLSLRRVAPAERRRRIADALELIRMTGLETRYPRELSGGQRQRVAIARALVAQPTLLLLDEPLSNLDAKLRHELRAEIKRLQQEVGVTTIFVTHDQEEALSLSDRIVVMNQGRIEQTGTPTEIYERPQTEFVFTFIGRSNRLEGRVEAADGERIRVRLASGAAVLVNAGNRMDWDGPLREGDDVTLYIRPEKVSIADGSSPLAADNAVTGRIVQLNYLGTAWEVEVLAAGAPINVLCPRVEPDWAKGSEVTIGWKSSDPMLTKRAADSRGG